jgi:uncharacterized protein (TIGR02246 family)
MAPGAEGNEPTAELAAIVERYNQAWNDQDLDTIMSFHTPDVVFENHTAGERVEGAQAVREHIAGIFSRWPEMRFRGRRLYAGEGFVACEWTATATRADGCRIEWDGVDLFPFRGGLIARKDVYSTSHAARVLE